MIKKNIKKILVIFTVFILTITISNYANASSLTDIRDGADDFLQSGQSGLDETIDEEKLQTMSDILYNILLAIAIVAAVIMGLFIGIRFMTGSIEQKAKIKETLIVYIAGCVIAFGAFGIWRLVINIMSQA